MNKSLVKLVRSLEYKKHRTEERLFVAEGTKTVGDLMSRFVPHTVIATREWWDDTADDARMRNLPAHARRVVVTDDELRRISFLQHPQQVMTLFGLPDDTTAVSADGNGDTSAPASLTLSLDGIQDPGNLGTIIRTADWFGIRRIVCSRDTADAYAPKVVQATMGSLARVDVTYTDLSVYLASLDERTKIYGTFLDGDDIYGLQLEPTGVIVMGNEGRGISENVARQVTHRLTIPRFTAGETGNTAGTSPDSLNVAVAAAIVCSQFRYGRTSVS